jgi:hypothetical protein
MASFSYRTETNLTLATCLSEPRFSVYLDVVGGLDVQAALDLYIWNLRLGAMFYGALAILEVALRNALHVQLSICYKEAWFNDPAFLQMAQSVLSAPRLANEAGGKRSSHSPTDLLTDISKVSDRVTRDLNNRAGGNLASPAVPTVHDIIAALDFGYWTSLLNRDLDKPLFSKGLYKAFPNFANRGVKKNPARGDVAGPLNEIRKFRNRLMHFEPIFKEDAPSRLQSIINVCSWIDPYTSSWIGYHTDLNEVLASRDRPKHRL